MMRLQKDSVYQTTCKAVLSRRQSRCPDVIAQVYSGCNTKTKAYRPITLFNSTAQ